MSATALPKLIAYAAAALTSILALASLFVDFALAPFAFLAAASIVLAGVGYTVDRAFADTAQRARDESDRAEILSVQLDQQRETVDALADGLHVAIFICEPKANIVYANQRALDQFRFEGPVGRSVLAVTLSYELEQLVAEVFRTGHPQDRELSFTYPEERVGIARAWADPSGGRAFLAIQDITHLRRLERVRQDFVANVSHELRTPLSVIRAMAETLLDEARADDEMGRKYLAKIIEEVDRLSLIANDLLVLSVAESNVVRKQSCDVAEIFRNVLGSLYKKAAAKSLSTSFEGPEHALIEANGAQMTQVALNLIDNAINYTTEGSVKVSVRMLSPEQVEVKVEDTGAGIASEHLPRVFERFYRVDKGRSRATGGTGLGLSIVKHIVESHGGTIEARSDLNRGSTFTVTLPVGEVRAPQPA